MAGNFAYYDVQGAAAGDANQRSPEERQVAEFKQMVHAAEQTNYDGDPEYYQQIKALAMQAGVPIKAFKTNPYRIAKAGLLSMADTMSFGLVPNDWYTPMNSAEQTAASIGGIAGMLNPYGGPAALFRGAGAVMKGGGLMNKMKNFGGGMGDDFMKGAFGRFGYKGGGAPGAAPVSTKEAMAQAKLLGTNKGPMPGPAPAQGNPAWMPTGGDPIMQKVTTDAARNAAKNPVILSNARKIVNAGKVTKPGANWKPGNMGGGQPPVLSPKIAKQQATIKANAIADAEKASKKYLNKKNKAETKASKIANKAQLKKTGPKEVVIKMNDSGAISKSELTKIKAMMKPSALRRLSKLKGKGRLALIKNWAKQKGIKIKITGKPGQQHLPLK